MLRQSSILILVLRIEITLSNFVLLLPLYHLTSSPAAAAGLLPGDEVVAFGGRPVRRVRDVVERLGYEPGRELKMQVKRKGAGLVDVILIASESLSRTKTPPVR